jgi:hypothetical protein
MVDNIRHTYSRTSKFVGERIIPHHFTYDISAAESEKPHSKDVKALEHMGTIEVRMHHVRIRSPVRAPAYFAKPGSHNDAMSEKAMIERAVTHNVE